MQHTPPSARASAPASTAQPPAAPEVPDVSFVTAAVKPATVAPLPDTYTPCEEALDASLSIRDFPTEASPTKRILISARNLVPSLVRF